ncbi:major facilitator superfamily transporter transporter [Fusarium heterosporum]|uniref:Major facilitator superfamily transporter transporter n=1 Tax=Fusarium heterosporum TaxID=42747 RepID=A0A8H5WLG8_FUSHE|nr:major facilitator superfamily transporter transporter [Fusarium heterosporum]
MASTPGYSIPSGAKRRFATPVPSRDAIVEEQELLLQPQDAGSGEQNEASEPSPWRQHLNLLALGYISFIFLKLSPGMFNTVLSQILEGILCRQYHDTTDPTVDPRCKDESVQGELSILLSMKATFELLPTVIFSIPYGLAADVYGRKPVLIVATTGCVIYGLVNLVICWFPEIFPMRLLLAVPLVSIIGGGPLVPVMMVYAMASDAVPESRRSGVFVVLSTGLVVGTLISGPMTYYLMPIGEWYAIFIAVGFQAMGLLTTFFIPETLVVKNEESDVDIQDRSSLTAKIRSGSQELLTKSFQSLRDIFWSDTTITLFVLSLLFIDVGEDIGSIITKQYAAKRFHLSWPEAGFITSMKSFAQLGLCLGALPYAQRVMRQSNISAIKQDVWIARTCLVILVIAYCMAGFADNLVVFVSAIIMSAVNFCLNPALRSLLLAMAHGAGAGAVLSAVEVLNAISAVVAGPVMAEGFRLGMGWGGMWLGLHWFIAMFILMLGAIIIICMRFDVFDGRRDS